MSVGLRTGRASGTFRRRMSKSVQLVAHVMPVITGTPARWVIQPNTAKS